MVNTSYKRICEAILTTSEEKGVDFRPLMRAWIKIFEDSRVVGWSREKFLDMMIKVKLGREE